MRKTERVILCCILALLLTVIALYMASDADNGRPAPVYQVSVILGEPVDSLEKGVNSAALAFNADIHSVRLTGGAKEAQISALERELASGADAVILVRCDAGALAAWLDGRGVPVPILSAEALPIRDRNVTNIAGDHDALSGLLADAIAADGGKGTVLLVTEDGGALTDGREAALRTALARGGIALKTATPWEAVSVGASRLLVAASPAIAEQLVATAPDGARIYGFGFEYALRGACESGRIAALSVISEFDAGYLALQSAVERLQGGRVADALLPGYLVRGDNLYDPPVSTILFPIE